jgi:hypothetical protein
MASPLLHCTAMSIVIRWTIGDVSSRGYDALTLSIRGARNIFGASARYVVCVNTVTVEAARRRVGPVASQVEWSDRTSHLPEWLLASLDERLAEGVAWKFAAVRLCGGDHVLSLDNDVILWRMPPSIRRWLEDDESLLIAEDVFACHGQFARFCPPEPRNSGIVGLPPFFDPEPILHRLLDTTGIRLSSETDEQGLQVALVTSRKHHVVPLHEVSVSGYFRPHMLQLGSCGAHFVGVNVTNYVYSEIFWDSYKSELAQKVTKAEWNIFDAASRYSRW